MLEACGSTECRNRVFLLASTKEKVSCNIELLRLKSMRVMFLAVVPLFISTF